MNIRHLLLVAGLFSAPQCLFAEDVPPAVPAPIDPFAPISTWAVCPPPPDRDYQLYDGGDPRRSPTDL
ncbi:MAG: hypothetical protein OEU48_07385, partial [Gammaproteobacteria bacterium]|nr:hypothetical protein [Gammaproteobacteria bacterium]